MDLHQSKYTGEEMDALFDKANYVIGTYSGDNTAERFIELGFTPSAVIVCNKICGFYDSKNAYYYGGIALNDSPIEVANKTIVKIVENGFNVYYNSSSPYIYSNINNDSYNPFRYIAFR